MSLETLLEAAKYLEYKTAAKARGEPHDYSTYAKLTNGGEVPSIAMANVAMYEEEEEEAEETEEAIEAEVAEEESPPSSNGGDEGGRERRRSLGVGTREVHNKLEKNRRAHLKECFDLLKNQLPGLDEKKTSNLSILRNALKHIQYLKRKQVEYEHELDRLNQEKETYEQRLSTLQRNVSPVDTLDITPMHLDSDYDNETNSTSTASECGPMSDDEERMEEGPLMMLLASSAAPKAHIPTAPGPSTKFATPVSLPPPPPSHGKVTTTRPVALSAPQVTGISATSVVFSKPAAALTAVAPSKPSPLIVSSAVLPTQVSRDRKTIVESSGGRVAETSQSMMFLSQIMPQPSGLHVGSGPGGVLAHPTAVQVITQPGMRVISASPATLAPLNSSAATTTTTFSNGVNLLAQKMVAVSSSNKSIAMPTMTLAKSKMVSVPMVQGAHPSGKTLTATVPLTIPTNLTSLPRTMTLQTAPMPAQGLVSFAGISAALSGAATLPARTLQVTNAGMKPTTQILQQTLSQQRTVISPAVRAHAPQMTAVQSQMNNLPRQILSAVKPVTHVRAPLTAQIAHVMQQTPLASVGQLVQPGGHMSAMTPLVGPVSMVNHAVAQMITQPQLGKVTVAASPILKPVGQIPLVQQQFLSSTQQTMVKPLVVVSTPANLAAAATAAAVTTTNPQPSMSQNTPVTLSAAPQC